MSTHIDILCEELDRIHTNKVAEIVLQLIKNGDKIHAPDHMIIAQIKSSMQELIT